jgi:hypothetical protein
MRRNKPPENARTPGFLKGLYSSEDQAIGSVDVLNPTTLRDKFTHEHEQRNHAAE